MKLPDYYYKKNSNDNIEGAINNTGVVESTPLKLRQIKKNSYLTQLLTLHAA